MAENGNGSVQVSKLTMVLLGVVSSILAALVPVAIVNLSELNKNVSKMEGTVAGMSDRLGMQDDRINRMVEFFDRRLDRLEGNRRPGP